MKYPIPFFGIELEGEITDRWVGEMKWKRMDFNKVSMLNPEYSNGSIDVNIFIIQGPKGYCGQAGEYIISGRCMNEIIIQISTYCIRLLAFNSPNQLFLQDEIDDLVGF